MALKLVYLKDAETIIPLLKKAAKKNKETMSALLARAAIKEIEEIEKKPVEIVYPEEVEPCDKIAEKILIEKGTMPVREFHKEIMKRACVSQKTVGRMKKRLCAAGIIKIEAQSIALL